MLSFDTVIGNRIGRIQILGLLGQGGMGQVYEGFDERLERRVAVERLDDSSRLNDVTKARFDQEAKLLSRPNGESAMSGGFFEDPDPDVAMVWWVSAKCGVKGICAKGRCPLRVISKQ